MKKFFYLFLIAIISCAFTACVSDKLSPLSVEKEVIVEKHDTVFVDRIDTLVTVVTKTDTVTLTKEVTVEKLLSQFTSTTISNGFGISTAKTTDVVEGTEYAKNTKNIDLNITLAKKQIGVDEFGTNCVSGSTVYASASSFSYSDNQVATVTWTAKDMRVESVTYINSKVDQVTNDIAVITLNFTVKFQYMSEAADGTITPVEESYPISVSYIQTKNAVTPAEDIYSADVKIKVEKDGDGQNTSLRAFVTLYKNGNVCANTDFESGWWAFSSMYPECYLLNGDYKKGLEATNELSRDSYEWEGFTITETVKQNQRTWNFNNVSGAPYVVGTVDDQYMQASAETTVDGKYFLLDVFIEKTYELSNTSKEGVQNVTRSDGNTYKYYSTFTLTDEVRTSANCYFDGKKVDVTINGVANAKVLVAEHSSSEDMYVIVK